MSPASAPAPTPPISRDAAGMPPRAQIVAITCAVAVLHVVGWGGLAWTLASGVSGATGGVLSVGLAATAYTLGLRHAFDADHIAAIDNTVRKLLGDGGRPFTVGLWFSLGHSSVVFLAALLIALGAGSLSSQLGDDSPLRGALGLLGTIVSGTFLLAIALVNLVSLVRLLRARRSASPAATMNDGPTGPLTRILRPALRGLRHPRQMYVIGFLFGLGFDTATEIALLAIAAGAGASGLPWYSIMLLPVLFAAGMSTLDAADGAVMTYAYRWSYADPSRRQTYNLIVTALSVGVAFVVGGIELSGVLSEQLAVSDGPLAALAGIDLTDAGIVLTVVLLVIWALAWVRARRRASILKEAHA